MCKRYDIDNTHRELHGALLDAQILADVYMAMTGGQVAMSLAADDQVKQKAQSEESADQPVNYELKLVEASEQERLEHEKMLENIATSCDHEVLWKT